LIVFGAESSSSPIDSTMCEALSTNFLHDWLSLVKCRSFDSPTPIPFWCDLDIFRRPEITFSLDNSGAPMHFDSSRLWWICTGQIIHNNCSMPSGFRVGVLQCPCFRMSDQITKHRYVAKSSAHWKSERINAILRRQDPLPGSRVLLVEIEVHL